MTSDLWPLGLSISKDRRRMRKMSQSSENICVVKAFDVNGQQKYQLKNQQKNAF